MAVFVENTMEAAKHGWWGALLVLIYWLCFLAVTFGLFNLIMAVFVENTMEAAKHDERKRRQARQHEHSQVARKLQKLVLQICSVGEGSDRLASPLPRQDNQKTGWFSRRKEEDDLPALDANVDVQ